MKTRLTVDTKKGVGDINVLAVSKEINGKTCISRIIYLYLHVNFILSNMNTKLPLNLDKNIIDEAKSYAKKNQVSLSKLIENYLHSLVRTSHKKTTKISPLVESLTGIISSEIDERKSYRDYLSEKYS